MHSPLPVAVVGAGRVAQAVYLRLLRDLSEDFVLTAVVETDKDRAAAVRRQCPGPLVTADLGEAVRAGARAAVCATPWPTHGHVVGECLDLDLPVLCEKPVSLDPDEVARLRRREHATGLPVVVGYMKRHDPVVDAFVRFARESLPELRLISVRVVDPNAPHQVSHLAPPAVLNGRSAATEAADRAVRDILGPLADRAVRTAYAHGLAGSLIHHVNLVNAVLDGSGTALLGRLSHVSQWDGGRSVQCGWQPSGAFGVQFHHVRVPGHRRYREVVEVVTERRWARLRLPSPYSRDDGAVLETEWWDDDAQLSIRSATNAVPGETGFLVQLRRWAAALRAGHTDGMPGLADAHRDILVVHEAATSLIRSPAVPLARLADPAVQ
jgi:predicted dehydrogenase